MTNIENKIRSLNRFKFGAHWIELLIADCFICIGAGFLSSLFNNGLLTTLAEFGRLMAILGIFLSAYVIGFLLLKTYNSFKSNLPYIEFIKCFSAVIIGTVIILLLNLILNIGSEIYSYKDIILQGLITLFGMVVIRVLVTVHYYYYGKRDSLNGVYGLSDISLLNLEMSDLLQRTPIDVNRKEIKRYLKGKTILITGAGGSIGSELARQTADCKPGKLILIDQAETPLHDIKMDLEKNFDSLDLITIVTDICHTHRMEHIFETYHPDLIFHAAAYKHVNMLEENPIESILNNVDGTMKLADLAKKYKVEKFILISTDKAVNPTSVMGCSKRLCEIYCQSLSNEDKRGTQFITTRFGNVLGSNGSVVPIFRDQIRNGGPVKVTHPDVIRYFMLIPEACLLVMEAALLGKGGEIFVFDMGEPVKIADLARRMIKISGKKDIQIEYIGLRPGEKLYEEVLNDEEKVMPTKHQKIKIAKIREYDYNIIKIEFEKLIETARSYDSEKTILIMREIVPEYR